MLQKLVNELKQDKNVMAVYLFGSHGTTRETPLSDIDICVFTRSLTSQDILHISSFGSEKVDVSIFDCLPLYVQPEVFKGKPLFVRDKYFVAEQYARCFRAYQDFKRYELRYWDVLQQRVLQRGVVNEKNKAIC